ncbi:hypothetical protein GCM10025876_35480 [Demequina litorisediminis]|uniref:Uncharacterized protein n=1 Tax=Demequina litorisediminis TaxID=1849022 RepID=A0ABQ6IHI9_9MICO|nr:hypothetical protein GCM10025876_35480 [Demequina litorisediminis]
MRGTGVRVEGVALTRRRAQPHLIGLPVDSDEFARDVREQRLRHRPSANDGAGPGGRTDGPRHDDGAVVVERHPCIVEAQRGLAPYGDVENRLGECFGSARTHRGGHALGAKDEPQARQHHGLARARLAGHAGQTRAEVDARGLDHAQVGDRQLVEHVSAPRA